MMKPTRGIRDYKKKRSPQNEKKKAKTADQKEALAKARSCNTCLMLRGKYCRLGHEITPADPNAVEWLVSYSGGLLVPKAAGCPDRTTRKRGMSTSRYTALSVDKNGIILDVKPAVQLRLLVEGQEIWYVRSPVPPVGARLTEVRLSFVPKVEPSALEQLLAAFKKKKPKPKSNPGEDLQLKYSSQRVGLVSWVEKGKTRKVTAYEVDSYNVLVSRND